MKQPVVLKVYHNDKLEAVRQFEDKQIVIGRSGDVHLELSDDSVSPLHAMIEDRGGKYYLSDLGSKSGTFVNKEKVLEGQLKSGDELRIGGYVIQFSIGVPKTVGAPAGSRHTAPPLPDEEVEQTNTDVVLGESRGVAMVAGGMATINPESPKPFTPPPAPVRPAAPPPLPKAPKRQDEERAPAVFFSPSTKKKGKTFAPPSAFKDPKEFVKPGKGTAVEVLVLWKERVLTTDHFFENGPVFIGGGEDADVLVPILSAKSKFQFLKIGAGITACLTPDMTGELIRENESVPLSELVRQNKVRNMGGGYEIDLRQGEALRVGLQNDMVSLMVRYKAESPKPAAAPFLDLTASEVTGIILACVIAAIFFLYMSLYAPQALLDDQANVEEPIRKAVVTFHPPKVVEVTPKDEPKQEKKIVEVSQKAPSVKAEKKTSDLKAQKSKEATKESVAKQGPAGKAGDVAPKKTQDKNKTLTSARPGGAIKTGPKQGANMKSNKPDPSKVGLLGAFASKGAQNKLDQAYSGSGELAGMASDANGLAGDNEDRPGDTMGTKLKNTGAGGKGSNTIGIAGLGTKGRGTGGTGYGSGGIGSHGGTRIDVGGQDADFQGSIDREAIRRVILSHKAEIRFCYDRELQSHPDLAGKIVIGWNIGEDGRVSNAGVASNAMGNSNVANCIVGKLRTWGFPPAPPDVLAHVSYPFVFSSN